MIKVKEIETGIVWDCDLEKNNQDQFEIIPNNDYAITNGEEMKIIKGDKLILL